VCARILCDLGAEVIKVESPSTEGKEEKRIHIDYNKLGLSLDTSRDSGRVVLLQLIARANVAVLDDSVSTLTLDEVRAARRDLIVARARSRSIDEIDQGMWLPERRLPAACWLRCCVTGVPGRAP
jgi:hypothetical protein